jgi:hypothetical protein
MITWAEPGQQVLLAEPEGDHDQAPDEGPRDQGRLHPGGRGQAGHDPQQEHDHDPVQHVQLDQPEGVAGPEQDAEDDLDDAEDPDGHPDAGGSGPHRCCSFRQSRQSSQPGRTSPNS